MNEKVWVGVDIGGTKTAVLVSTAPPEVLARIEFATQPDGGPDYAIRQIIGLIRSLLASTQSPGINAIGISCGSPLDRVGGIIQSPPNLPGWINVPIRAVLEDEFGVPCRLENDANAGAVAEYRFGAGQGSSTMIFVTMGTGFGAGIVIEGRPYHGVTDSAGEIGHVRLTRGGPVGYNKAGSVEGWASGGGIAQVARAMLRAAEAKGQPTALTKVLERDGALSAKNVAGCARDGDIVARKVLVRTGRKAGEALAIMIDLLNPDRIVIGGIAMRLGDLILNPARKAIQREALPHAAGACQIVTAQLDERIGDVAALCIAMDLVS